MLCIKQFMSISKCFPGKSFYNWHGGQALCFAHKVPTQMCTEQTLAISGSFACTNCTKYKLLCTKSRQWSACCPVECKPWACNKISNFTRGLTFIINDLHFHAMCILELKISENVICCLWLDWYFTTKKRLSVFHFSSNDTSLRNLNGNLIFEARTENSFF